MSTKSVQRILESAGQLKQLLDNNEPVAQREVKDLRNAFDKLHNASERWEYSKKAIQCDNLLSQLENRIKSDENAQTGDTEKSVKNEKWKFANIPKRRRLQTLVVSLFLFFTGVPFFITLSALLFFNWITMPFIFAYCVYMVLTKPKHPLKKRQWLVSSSIWHHYRDYFPIRLVVPKDVRQKFTKTANYMFIYHPHGIHGFGAMINFTFDANHLSQLLPGITVHVQTLAMNFWIPFWRELFTLSGSGDASASCIKRTLAAGPGESVMLVVGGAEESLLSMPNTNDLTLQKRKGFVRLALESGAPLVPVYGFGENNVYDNLAAGRPKLQKFLLKAQKLLGFALPLIHGRGWFNYHFGILPHRRPIVVVVGAPLEVPRILKPSKEEIDEWHAKYIDALKELYLENKDVYDLKSTGMRIVQ